MNQDLLLAETKLLFYIISIKKKPIIFPKTIFHSPIFRSSFCRYLLFFLSKLSLIEILILQANIEQQINKDIKKHLYIYIVAKFYNNMFGQ